MVARFALAFEYTSDEILGLKKEPLKTRENISLRYTKRIKEIEEQPEHKIKIILKTLDDSIKANK